MDELMIMICDDEMSSLCAIKKFISKNLSPYVACHQIREFQSVKSLLNTLAESRCDICFLDIDMPEMNGIMLAQQVCHRYPDTLIVFVSAKEEYVFQSFQVHPFSFVRKNHFPEDMKRTLNDLALLLQKREQQKQTCRITDAAGYDYTFPLDSICYLEAQEKYVRIVLSDREKLLRCSLKNLEKELAPYDMVRCHKSYIVNMKKVYAVKHDHLILLDKTTLPIRRGMVTDLKKQLCRLLTQ